MKVVIIGGGIAGLTLGIFLRKKNIEVVINEKLFGVPNWGHAFLTHSDGLAVLRELSDDQGYLPGKKVDAFSLRRPDGEEVKHTDLDSWHCIKRFDLVRYLYSLVPPGMICEGRQFSHFIYEKEKAIAAAFTNGDVEYGDIFVGADGGNSKVREAIHGKVKITDVQVKEVVGISNKNKKLSKSSTSTFTKFQSKTSGLAFGMIPTSGMEFVWFMQYDPMVADVTDSTPDGLRAFCYEQLKDFPGVVGEILDFNNFSTSYIWNTRDFDLLPSFHKENIVLIGDAAHLALPFTSAGTTNAVVDAQTLVQCLTSCRDYHEAFNKYYALRASEVGNHVKFGRQMKELFLHPGTADHEPMVPLITHDGEPKTSKAGKKKPIRVVYFTDPICSTCWIIQPLLRKLSLEYRNYLDIEYQMGGLLPSWHQYNKGKIRKPSDAAKHWEEVCVMHEMPLDGDVWIEDPLPSSYPPSIAFKAAQLQDNAKAVLFLRRIKEMVFLEKKNIIKWDYLEKAANEVGLDADLLLRDFEGRATDLFKEDLKLASKYGVTSFPTLFFSDDSNETHVIKGFQPYEKFEDIIQKLVPDAKKERINPDPQFLFTNFPTMTNKEFAFLSGLPKDEANATLASLYSQGLIDKYQSKNGIIWISKLSKFNVINKNGAEAHREVNGNHVNGHANGQANGSHVNGTRKIGHAPSLDEAVLAELNGVVYSYSIKLPKGY
jgi:predicted DsbA family dithiol-disulfide isomerase/2-polyprenyl-6-methoxyphenol hydroxylase-like FAD-dependent oxidoreductase